MNKTKKLTIKLIKEPLTWFAALLLILGVVLIANFSTKIIYNVKYTTTASTIIFNNKTKTAVQYNNQDITERLYYNYIIVNNCIYLYEQGSDDSHYTYKLNIENKFILSDEHGKEIRAEGAEDAFMVLISINGFIAIIVFILTVEKVKDYCRKKKKTEVQSSENTSRL